MKVAHYLALDDFGGLQTLFLSLADHLAGRGNPPITINRASASPLARFQTDLSTLGIAIESPRLHRKMKLIALGRRTKLRRFMPYAENFAMGREFARIAKKTGYSRMLSWNALPPTSGCPQNTDVVLYDHGMSSIQKPVRMSRERLKRASKIISISKANEILLRERWGWDGPVDILMNPLRHQIATEPLPQSPRSLSPDRPLILGCASRLKSFKGIVSVVHATAELLSDGVDVRLRIAGDGEEAENLRVACARLGIEHAVEFCGLIDDMNNFFGDIDIFIAPSMREPYGLSPLEALSLGIPTVLSSVDGHVDVPPFEGAAILIEPTLSQADYRKLGSSLSKMPPFVFCPSSGGLVRPQALDPHAIATAVSDLAENYPERSATTLRAAREVRVRNSMSRYADRLNVLMEN